MPEKPDRSDCTRCVESHHDAERFDGAMVTPIYQTSNYRFINSQELIDLQEGRGGRYIYARYSNPTVETVEARLADLERTTAAQIFSSGQAATATICLSFLRAGDRLLASNSLYGGTIQMFNNVLGKLGIKIEYLSLPEFSHLENHLERPARMLWFETPVNPTLDIIDIEAVSATCRKHGVLTVCDNTFATSINQKPHALGVDIVMHSASKYIGGHSDLIGGVAAGSADTIQQIHETRKSLGGVCDPQAAFLMGRGLKTLAVRVERHNQNARIVADHLARHGKIRQVFYPGLPDFPGHGVAKKQMHGFGGMLTVEIDGGQAAAIRVIDSFKLIANAASLGGVESMACLPALTSHFGMSADERQAVGIPEGMIRLSIGLEDPREIIADLNQALGAL